MEDSTMAAVDPQSKKWQLTINNPQTCGLDRDRLLDILNQFSLDYFALCDEVGASAFAILQEKLEHLNRKEEGTYLIKNRIVRTNLVVRGTTK